MKNVIRNYVILYQNIMYIYYFIYFQEYIWNYTLERDKIVKEIQEIMEKYNEEICHNIIPTNMNIILQSQEMINKKLTKYTIEEYINHYNDLKQCIDDLKDYYTNYTSNVEQLKEKMYFLLFFYFLLE